MTYKETYYSIIENRKKNPLPDDQYGEVHHIKPKCIYPELKRDKDNLVRLTAYEHFKCHYLLVKIYEEDGNSEAHKKMALAFNRMSSGFAKKHLTDEEVEEASLMYQTVRYSISKAVSELMSGKFVSEETRKKLSVVMKGKQNCKGIPKSEEHRRKISEALIGRKGTPRTEEWNRKNSEAQKLAWKRRKQKKSQVS